MSVCSIRSENSMPKIMGLLMLIYQLVKRRANMQHYLMHKDLSTDPCTFKFRTWQKWIKEQLLCIVWLIQIHIHTYNKICRNWKKFRPTRDVTNRASKNTIQQTHNILPSNVDFFHSLYFGSRLERIKMLSLVCYGDIYETRYKVKFIGHKVKMNNYFISNKI